MSDQLYLYLRLLKAKGLGVRTIKKILDIFEDLSLLFNDKFLRERVDKEQISLKIYKSLTKSDPKDESDIKKEIEFMQKNNISYLGYYDKDFPAKLKNCNDCPCILFTKGTFYDLNQRSLAIVGARKATNYGIEFTKKLVYDLCDYKPIIVSGLAFGIDITTHTSALKNKLPTLAVLGTSLSNIYPKEHLRKSKEIERNGLIISEYPTWTKSNPKHFVQRNRIIAGLSDATIVIESAEKGGSLSTAKFANDYSREVFALTGRYNDLLSKGCLNLIQKHLANILTDSHEIVEMLNWKNTPKKTEITNEIDFSKRSEKEQKILQILNLKKELHIDELAILSNLKISELNGLIMFLEIDGFIVSKPGKTYALAIF